MNMEEEFRQLGATGGLTWHGIWVGITTDPACVCLVLHALSVYLIETSHPLYLNGALCSHEETCPEGLAGLAGLPEAT